MTAKRVAFVLFVSVLANVWQWRQRGRGQHGDASPHQAPQRELVVVAEHPLEVPSSNTRNSPFQMCTAELDELRDDVTQLKTDMAATEDAGVRFRRSQRTEAQTLRLTPDVQRIVAQIPGVTATTECREEACQVHVSAPNRASVKATWTALLKDPVLRDYANQFASESGDPSVDSVTGTGSFESDLYVVVDTVSDYSTAILGLLKDFEMTQEFVRCRNVVESTGVLECKVVVDPGTQKLLLATGGDGVSSPAGICIARELASYLSSHVVPAGVKYGQAYASYECTTAGG